MEGAAAVVYNKGRRPSLEYEAVTLPDYDAAGLNREDTPRMKREDGQIKYY